MLAEGRDVIAQRVMVPWLRALRENVDAIVGTRLVRRILVGWAPWNLWPILFGSYANGTAIVDPDTLEQLGVWSAGGTVAPADDHLDHVHISVIKGRRPGGQ
jgi:hypothetical protein